MIYSKSKENKNKFLRKKEVGNPMEKKMTYVMALETVIATLENGEVKTKLEALKSSLEKKNGAERKPTEKQKENEVLKADIVEFMEVGKGYTVTEVLKAVPSLDGMSQQKVSALMNALVKELTLYKVEEKRVSKFYKR